MGSKENNKIIKIYKELNKDFFDKYYAEHDFDSVFGGRIINNTFQLRLGLGHILGTKENVELFNKIINIFEEPKYCDFDTVYYYAVVDLFINDIKDKESLKVFWRLFREFYSDSKDYRFLPELYDFERAINNEKEDEYMLLFNGIELKDPNVFPDPDFFDINLNKNASGLLSEMYFNGSNSFFRIYEIFDIRDKKCQSEYIKYLDLDYGLDKFDKQIT